MTRALTASILFSVIAATGFGMDIGTNFWNLNWHKSSDCFMDVKNVTGDNPWNPQFLKEIAIYTSLRFMDWDNTNGSKRSKWSERPLKSAAQQNPVAYEWMIDLCNRTNADMWVTLPHMTVDRNTGDKPADYALRLCILVKTGVDMKEVDLTPMMEKLSTMTAEDFVKAGGEKTTPPLKEDLKLYVEYSNETWNGQFKQTHYCLAEGTALKLDANGKPNDKGEIWSNSFRFHAYAAVRVFAAADLVFGAPNPRIVKVLATQTGQTFICGQHQAVMQDEKLNPWKTKADAIAAAPYFGNGLIGDNPEIVAQLREAMMKKSAEGSRKLKEFADKAELKLIAYEGGQHVIKQADKINKQQVMFDLYNEYLTEMSKYYSHFCHYAHVGGAKAGGCWGSIEFTGQAVEEAPKYRALVEWSKVHNKKDEKAAPAK